MQDEIRGWLALLLCVVSIGAGVIAVIHPVLTALVLVLMMGANALIIGVLNIAVALEGGTTTERRVLPDRCVGMPAR